MKIDKHDVSLIIGLLAVIIGLLSWASTFDFAFPGQVQTGMLIGFGLGVIIFWIIEQWRHQKHEHEQKPKRK